MLDLIRADTRRLREYKTKPFPWFVVESLLFENGYQAIVLYRIASWFKRHRVPFFGAFFARLNLFLTGVDIHPAAEIGPGLLISHGTGLVIGGQVRIGAGAILLHRVTVGATGIHSRDAMPVVGDNVFIGAGACLIGPIRVGDDVFVGANALVTGNVESGMRVLAGQQLDVRPRGAGEWSA